MQTIVFHLFCWLPNYESFWGTGFNSSVCCLYVNGFRQLCLQADKILRKCIQMNFCGNVNDRLLTELLVAEFQVIILPAKFFSGIYIVICWLCEHERFWTTEFQLKFLLRKRERFQASNFAVNKFLRKFIQLNVDLKCWLPKYERIQVNNFTNADFLRKCN